jgi:hypothetical protein
MERISAWYTLIFGSDEWGLWFCDQDHWYVVPTINGISLKYLLIRWSSPFNFRHKIRKAAKDLSTGLFPVQKGNWSESHHISGVDG